MVRSRFDADSSSIADAQREMRYAYHDGAPGVLVSGTVWLIAGLVAASGRPERAIWSLFIGGMFIHPVSVLLNKMLGRPGTHTPGNPLGALALEGTIWMLLSLPLVYAVSTIRMEWFFPAMLFVIGGRYLTFATMYGKRIYWAFGAALAFTGYVLGSMNASPQLGAFAGAGIEALFASFIFITRGRGAAIRQQHS